MAAVQFFIADTFSDSLARLTNDEQKAAKLTAFDLQLDAENPGMRLHKLDRARDKRFWSVRVSRDVRLIVHKISTSLVLCYVDHHDKAYRWAERRELVAHPSTGAAQLVEWQDPNAPTVQHPKSGASAHGTFLFAKRLGPRRTSDEMNASLSAADGSHDFPLIAELQDLPSHSHSNTGSFDHPDARLHFQMIADTQELLGVLNFTLADADSFRSTIAQEGGDLPPQEPVSRAPARILWPEQVANRRHPPKFGRRKN